MNIAYNIFYPLRLNFKLVNYKRIFKSFPCHSFYSLRYSWRPGAIHPPLPGNLSNVSKWGSEPHDIGNSACLCVRRSVIVLLFLAGRPMNYLASLEGIGFSRPWLQQDSLDNGYDYKRTPSLYRTLTLRCPSLRVKWDTYRN